MSPLPSRQLAPTSTALPACSGQQRLPYPYRVGGRVQRVVVHRIEVSGEDPTYADTPQEVWRFFAEHPTGLAACGGKMPYPLLIDGRGQVAQLLPLRQRTPHVARHNDGAVGIGCIGDFRRCSPSPAQWRALVGLAAVLLQGLRLGPEALVGHDALSGGSRDPNKICPGPGLDLARLRQAVVAPGPRPEVACDLVWG